ncbi:MAG: MATE family efflux transporter [Prevotellaceae bacterium]|jgi:putative MATE family efflux protein|nr:MATE family efflux transporter [Prevotellaceae bacterium]
MQKVAEVNILETEKVGRLLYRYALPSIISSLMVALYNVVDRIFIGHGVGAMAISGLALTFPLLNLLQAFGTLIGVGAATRMSIVLGMKDVRWAEKILGHSLLLTLTISGTVIVLSTIFIHPILQLFGGSEQTIPYAAEYLYYVIPGSIFTSLSFNHAGLMRSSGYPRKSMMVILLGAALNIILDPVFIFVFDMGIQGAAIATVLSMMVSAAFAMHHFFKPSSFIRYRKYAFNVERRIVRNIIAIGLSPFLINAMASIINVVMNQLLVTHGGDVAIGANGIISGYGIVVVMIIFGLCQGMQPIAGYNYGAQRLKRVKDAYKLTVKAASVVTVASFVLAMLTPRQMAMVFTSDPELLDISTSAIRITFMAFAVIGFQIVTGQFFQAIGKVKKAIFLSLSRQAVFLLPALLVGAHLWGLTGVFVSLPVSDFLAFAVSAWMIFRELRHFSVKS